MFFFVRLSGFSGVVCPFFPLVYQMEVKNCLQVVVLQSYYTLNKTGHFFVTLMNLACHFYLYMHRLCFMRSHIHSLFYPGFFFASSSISFDSSFVLHAITHIHFMFLIEKKRNNNNDTKHRTTESIF